MSQMLSYIVESLREIPLEKITDVSAETGINKWTLLAIRKGGKYGIENPGIKTAEPLYKYFKGREGKRLRRRAA